MTNPTPVDQIKHDIRQIISRAFKQFKGNLPQDQWSEFESLFWKIRPLVSLDYTQWGDSMQAETSGPKPKETSVVVPQPGV